jgi:antitoxin MazE
MKTRVAKWGNSLALRLPKAVTSSLSLKEGTEIELTEHAEGILLRPAGLSYDLEELIKEIRPDNLHTFVETGKPTGKEVW